MVTIERDNLRVVLGALNRAQQIDLWQVVDDMPDDLPALVSSELLADHIAIHACRRILIRNGEQWEPVTGASSVQIDDEVYNLNWPFQLELFHQLPVTLTNEWLSVAMRLNEGVSGAYFLASNNQMTGENSSSSTPSSEG